MEVGDQDKGWLGNQMTTQQDMFQNFAGHVIPILHAVCACPATPAQRDSETSKDAARAAAPTAAAQSAAVLAYLRGRGDAGATREEIAAALGIRIASVCARVWQLINAHPSPLAVQTEQRRLTQSRRSAYVLKSV